MKYFLKSILALITALFIASCTAAKTADSSSGGGSANIIANSSFESGLGGWTTTDSSLGTNGDIFLTNDTVDGSQAVCIRTTNNGTVGLVQYVAYQTNKIYVLSAYLKDSIPNYKNMVLELCDTSSNTLIPQYLNIFREQTWTGWTNIVLQIPATNIPGFIKVKFYVEKNISGEAEFIVDNVMLSNY